MSANLRMVPTDAVGRVTITSPITHQCPHVDETDEGTITVAWTLAGATIEFHSLAAYLASYAEVEISHEDLVAALKVLLTQPGLRDVAVTARFTTAGLGVEVSSAVPGEPVHPPGA